MSYRAPVLVGARVATTSLPERRYGLFEPAIDAGASAARSVVIPDLRQDATTRTNLGIVNLTVAVPVRLEIFDGATGRLAASRDLPALAPNELRQLNGVLRELAPSVARGWARLVPAGGGALGAFAVILDGAEPGLGTDDGAFVPGVPE